MKQPSTVLIVDDDPILCETMQGLLSQEGHTFVLAKNGEQAIAAAIETLPDVILLDVVMPGEFDGFKVCQLMRKHPLLTDIPIIMVTALDDRDSLLRAIEAGADDFISKPFDRIELQTRVRTTVKFNRYRRLMAERLKFEWVVEQADDGYLVLDSHNQILYLNSKARIYLDLPETQLPLAKNFLEIAAQQYQQEPQSNWHSWPDELTGNNPRFLVRPETPTAQVLWLQVTTITMAIGPETEYLVRLRDITATVKSQRLMWSFHGQISHKLRTPLSNLKMAVTYLCHYDDLNQGELNNLFEMAESEVALLEAEIDDIFAYIEIPDMSDLKKTGLRLPDIERITTEVKSRVAVETIEINLPPLTNQGDMYLSLSKQAFELIMRELLENAKKFHPEKNPQLKINASLEENNQAVLIQICDDGIRLPPDKIPQIWMPYYQVEKYFSGQISGMGLGLSMVASLICDVDGSYRAYNRPNEPGMVIELKLPIANGYISH